MNRDLCELAVRIAVQQVWRKAPRSIAAFLGIAGGIVLVLVQLGFQSALYDSAVRLHRVFKGELVIAPAAFSTVTSAQWFSRDRLLTTLAHPDVASAAPLYLSHIPLRNIDNGSREVILAIGIELDAPAIDLTTIQADVHNLRADGHVLFDIKSQPFFVAHSGKAAQERPHGGGRPDRQ